MPIPPDEVMAAARKRVIDEQLRVRMDLPTWEEFAEGTAPSWGRRPGAHTPKARVVEADTHVSGEEVWPSLSDADRAMARSQRGPFAAALLVALLTCRHSKFDPQVFRVLLRRRLRLLLPLSSHSCRCGLFHDPLGHHRPGCSEAGVLGKRGFFLSKAAEQVCREAGAR